MPIEIRELTIKVNVNQDQNKASTTATAGNGEEDEKQALIQQAAEEILRILENAKER